MRRNAALIVAAGVATAAFAAAPDAHAQWGWGHRAGWYGGYARPWGGYYRSGWGWGGPVATGLAAGAVGGLVASSIAAPAYAYGCPGYGYSPYGFGYPVSTVRTVEYVDPAPVVVRRRVVYRAPIYPRRIVVRRGYRYGSPIATYRPRARFYRSASYGQRLVYGAQPAYRMTARYRAY